MAARAAPGAVPAPETGAKERPGLPSDVPDTAAARGKLLGDLYDRLGAAETPENAEIIASAIENLWLRSGSATVDLLMTRAKLLIQGGQSESALQVLNSIIELAPGYSEGWARRAVFYFKMKDFGKSLDDLRHALALDPSHYKAIQGLGILMRELGDKEAALQAVRKALKVYPHLEGARRTEEELTRDVEGQDI